MKKTHDLSSAALHIMAMVFMLSDHLWATLLPMQEWMSCLGRLAFPIFAFLTVEGYFHTKNLKRYLLRLLIFALISEVPFDLMYGGTVFYPFHQNVLWTFLIALLGIAAMEWAKRRNKVLYVVISALVVLLGYGLGTLTMVDYFGAGVLTVFVFYFFRKRQWWCPLLQIAALYWINVELLGGQIYLIDFAGLELELYQQSLALLSLIPIWLYRGRQGHHSKAFQYTCYVFYPAHLLVLGLAVM